MKTDALFYRLFQALPGLVFELARLDDLDGRSYRFRSEEVKQTAFRLDGLLEPPETNPAGPVVFVEVQMQAEEVFYGRWFAEIFLYLYRMTPVRPWRAVVIHPNRQVERLDERRYGSVVKLPEVHRVYLEDWADVPAHTVGLRLVQLLAGEAAEAPARGAATAARAGGDGRLGIVGERVAGFGGDDSGLQVTDGESGGGASDVGITRYRSEADPVLSGGVRRRPDRGPDRG
jgi:predicted transposase YdaD